MKYACIVNDVVVNVILWDGEEPYTTPEGDLVEAADDVSIGWLRREGALVAPPEPEPEPTPTPESSPVTEAAVAELVAIGLSEETARLLLGEAVAPT